MGDLLSPRRRDVVVDRLRRRIDVYRRHNLGCRVRYEPSFQNRNEQTRRETLLLYHRLLESKAKKNPKQSKNRDPAGSAEHRNVSIVTQKSKSKKDNRNVEVTAGDGVGSAGGFNFDDQASSPLSGPQQNPQENTLPGLSVKIVQQINSQPEHAQTIHTNVTVTSVNPSLKARYGSGDSPQGGGVQASASVECKQEPCEEGQCLGSQSGSSQNSLSDTIGLGALGLDPDDLQTILDNLDKEDLKGLDDFYLDKENRDGESGDPPASMFAPLPGSPPGLHKGAYGDAAGANNPLNPIYDANQNMGPVRAPMQAFRGSHQHQQVLTDTGPAAETLKQMAAQHQNQQTVNYGMKSPALNSFPDPLQDVEQFNRGNGYTSYPPPGMQHTGTQNAFSFSQQQHINQMRSQQVPPGYPQQIPNKQDLSLSYGATKPLSHFPEPMGQVSASPAPSSLQQLQDQVRAHFNQSQSQQMQITQTQQMQVSHGAHRMQMSQTQQLQMQQAPQQISITQQQSLSMNPAAMGQGQFMNDQMNMMHDKVHSEHARQAAKSRDQLLEQQQHAQPPPPCPPQMQQYMGRPPPPDYKLQGSTCGSGSYGSNAGAAVQNPLQTMQNMINQTNHGIQPAYGAVKSEVGSGPPAGFQASGAQQISTSVSCSPALSRMSPNSAVATSYPSPSLSRHPTYHATQPNSQTPAAPGTVQVRSQRPLTPNYKSTIMRNQRPPNVNVGPDGLNISRPRSSGEWPRPMMQAHGGVRMNANNGPMMTRMHMPGANLMQYGTYSNTTMPPGHNPHLHQTQSNSQMMLQQQQQQQQQSIQLSQRMNVRTPITSNQPSPSFSMASTVPMTASGPVNTQQNGYPVSSIPDDFMNFLDSAQSSNADLFDSIQNSSSSDFNLLEEILGK